MQLENYVIVKVTTSSKSTVELMEIYATLFNNATQNIGVRFYAESIANGIIIYYPTMNDFFQFLDFIFQSPSSLDSADVITSKHTLTLRIDVIKNPSEFSLDEAIVMFQKTYSILSMGLAVK